MAAIAFLASESAAFGRLTPGFFGRLEGGKREDRTAGEVRLLRGLDVTREERTVGRTRLLLSPEEIASIGRQPA